MAQVDLKQGLWYGSLIGQSNVTVNTGTFVMDATGEHATAIIQAPRTGTIRRVEAYIATVTNAPDNGLRFSLQGVSATTGQRDGVVKGSGSAAATTAAGTPSAAGWVNPGNFASLYSATRGELLAVSIDFASFVTGDSIIVGGTAWGEARNFPYSISVTTTKNTTIQPIMALVYVDSFGEVVYPMAPGWLAMKATNTSIAYNVNTVANDEVGLAWTPTFPCRLRAVMPVMGIAAGANFDVVVYDGVTNPATSFDGDQFAGTSNLASYLLLSDDVPLTAGVEVIVSIKPTTTNNLTVIYVDGTSMLALGQMTEDNQMYLVSRVDGGSWKRFNTGGNGFRTLLASLQLGAIDTGGGGGVAVIGPGGVVF